MQKINEVILDKEVRRAIKRIEAIAATHASFLNGVMAGVLMLQDCWECVEDK